MQVPVDKCLQDCLEKQNNINTEELHRRNNRRVNNQKYSFQEK